MPSAQVPEFYYAEFSRQFRLWKRERSGGYVTDDKDENVRKGRVRKERNYFKTAFLGYSTLPKTRYNLNFGYVTDASGAGASWIGDSILHGFRYNPDAVSGIFA